MSTIADRFPITAHPDGWYPVALSGDVAPGRVLPLSVLGQELVLFRTESGEARVLDAYCVHLGAHLGHGGTVEGESLVCPFHGWAFGREGRCVAIPYAKRVPRNARVRAWPVMERNGAILVWNHHLGKEPFYEIPEFESEPWTPIRWEHLMLEMHIFDLAENAVDIGHFPKVHGCDRWGAEMHDPHGIPFDFDLLTSYPGDGIGMPGQQVKVTTHWRLYGPGVFEGTSSADDFGMRVRQLFHFTPLPGDQIHVRIGISVDKETIPEELREFVLEQNAKIAVGNLLEDAPIWKRKRFQTAPILCEGDGPIPELRAWMRQFFPELGG
jgi:phenylpropionate dioxygenase-like ring-hydroxylating dioxygenase large terminal subunit